MGIGSNKIGKVLVVVLVVLSLASASARELNDGIWKVMRDGGFGHGSGTFHDDEDRVWPIGDMDVGARHYRFMHYEYLQSKQNMVPGGVQHGYTALLVFERTKTGLVYLGKYENSEGGRPRIKGHSLIFPYKDVEILGVKMGKVIAFDEKGPPARVRLRDNYVDFQK